MYAKIRKIRKDTQDMPLVVSWGYIGPIIRIKRKQRTKKNTQNTQNTQLVVDWGYIGPIIRIKREQFTKNRGYKGQFGVK
jgi:predicted DNA-binding WGR domain protein